MMSNDRLLVRLLQDILLAILDEDTLAGLVHLDTHEVVNGIVVLFNVLHNRDSVCIRSGNHHVSCIFEHTCFSGVDIASGAIGYEWFFTC